MFSQLKTATLMLLAFTVLTGLVYPLAITGIAQVVFPLQANGSLIHRDGKVVGSELIGQSFDDPAYFWSRPSATGPYPYNAAASSGSNLAISNPAQSDAITQRVNELKESDPTNTAPIPIDLVTASGSGLDPHISVAAARWQVRRVAKTRSASEKQINELVDRMIVGSQLGILGEPGVNVLKLNLEMDKIAPRKTLSSSPR